MPEPQIILPRSSFFLIKDRYMSYIYHIFSIGNLCLPDWELEGQWFLAGGKKLKIPGAEVFRYLIIRLWELSGASRGTDRWSLETLPQLLLENIGRGKARTFSKAHAFIFQMEKEVPYVPLISLNQRRARSSFFFWNSCHSQISRVWGMLWEEATWSQWSCLVPTLAHRKLNRGCSLQSKLQSCPLTWMEGGSLKLSPEDSVLKEWRYSAALPRISDLKVFSHLTSFWLQVLLPFLSSFHEMIKGEYLSDSLEGQ